MLATRRERGPEDPTCFGRHVHTQLQPRSSQEQQSTARSRRRALAQHRSPCLLSDRLTWPFPSRVNGSADFGQDLITNCFPDLGCSSPVSHSKPAAPPCPPTKLRTPSSVLAGLMLPSALFFSKNSSFLIQRRPQDLREAIMTTGAETRLEPGGNVG